MEKYLKDEYLEIIEDIKKFQDVCINNSSINTELYKKFEVKRGLRELNGKGVLTGLTEISEIQSTIEKNGLVVPCEGKLFYRGIDVDKLVEGFVNEKRFGFEETVYLLILGELPGKEELKEFKETLANFRTLPTSFVRDIILQCPSKDMMNVLSRTVLTLYAYDDNANDTSVHNVLRQCLQLIAAFPLLAVYGYQAYRHYYHNENLFINKPKKELSTAENILTLLRKDGEYTELEARILDIALVLHAEHGGGNNSTFTTHVVSSSGTDTYSVIASSLGSLKGPKHGGANIKVMQMMQEIKENVSDWTDEEEVRAYIEKIVNKEAFDKSGLVYGIGHAVYSVSDPRAKIFKKFVKMLSEEKGTTKEFQLYQLIEKIAPEIIAKRRNTIKPICANIDFYSGFVYKMLNLPTELYTPLFAMARVAGWSAHRIEELINTDKIMRPTYMNVAERKEYVPIGNR